MHLLFLLLAPAVVQGWAPLKFSVASRASTTRRAAGARVLAAHPGGSSTTEAPATSGFINDVMRPYAMKLHTRAQAPKEGQAPEKEEIKPMREWR